MIVALLYFAIGAMLVIPRFPRWFVAWTAKEWPTLGWEMMDTFMCVVFTFFAVALWPLLVLVVIINWLAGISLHARLSKLHVIAKEQTK